MKNTQIIADRIKSQAKLKGLTVKLILESCELGVNTVTKMNNGTDIFSQNLLKIADYLDCSVDYLLGRTDNPNINHTNNNINQQYIGGNATANINTADSERSDADAQELLDMIKQLSIVQRAEIILKINEMLNEK